MHHWYNAGMLKNRLNVLYLLVEIGLLISACRQTPVISTPEGMPTLEGTLRPYPSDTPSATPFPTEFITPTASPTVTPTPTPVYYDVQDGDDMYGIAFYYGISPQELMTANPTVNPRAMGPGTTLLIPVTPGPEPIATSMMTHTPSSPTQSYARLADPDCYPDASGGLWCFILVVNDRVGALENVSGLVTLTSDEDVWQENAVMPLNLLPEGESLPLIAYFQPPIPEDYSVSAVVDFYLPVMPDDTRYLPVEIQEQKLVFFDGRESVRVSGEVNVTAEDSDADYLWLQATAFDVNGNIVAARRWEADGPIQPGEGVEFEVTLYSLGGPIGQVDLLAEMHRQQESTPTPTP